MVAMPIHGPDEPVYTIGVMARVVGVSLRTLRAWERDEIVGPHRRVQIIGCTWKTTSIN